MKPKELLLPADIPLEINSYVEQWMTYFTGKGSVCNEKMVRTIW